MPSNPEPTAAEKAALKIAIALDTLGGRIYRDIHPETADIAEDPEVDKVLTGFMAYAEERLAVLDDPEVKAVLDAAMAREEGQR
jgi:hypothetical protein